jgi:GTPase SAR1 family protein
VDVQAGVSLLSLALREHAHVTTILDLLLAAGVDPNRHYKVPWESPIILNTTWASHSCWLVSQDLGTTPLVFTSLRLYSHSGALRTLLEGGARPQLLGTCPFKVLGVSMVSPLAALFLSLERDDPHGTSDYAVYEMAYLLACHGAVWTDDCELLLRKQLAPVQTVAMIRACFKDWSTDPNASSIRGLLDVPREVIERGYHAVGAYLSAMRASGASGVVLRRKVCVVGPSCWGKTSLVRSITTRAPSLVHEDDRTIGIDLFAWTFPDDTSRATHQVTFWDFAGQDEYQAAHTLFFSRRTLFLVCVDVGAYAEALHKLETSHDADREHATVEMDAFVAANLTRWVRTIFARQPDVQFALVLTKADAVGHDTAQLARVEADVRARLASVRETVCTEIKRAIRKLKSTRAKMSHEITRLRSLKQKAASNLSPTTCVAVSCKGIKWVLKAQRDLRRVVCDARHQSFCMPETYSRVLQALVASRPPADEDAGVRVRATFVKLDAVYDSLTAQPGLQSLTKETCTEILRILHDLGDVLWYEELHASPLLCKTLVLEPQLLLEFLRQVVNHHHAPGRVGDLLTHKTLRALPYWSAIRDDEALLLALKTLLHHVQLAYPTRRAPMVWDSDLIVPCYWRRSRVVARQGDRNSLPLSLRDPSAGVACRVRFDYELGAEPPETLFEHLAVTTYSTLCARTVESDRRIVFGSPDPAAFACRLWTRREVASGVVVRIEAVAADRHSSTDGWQIFQHACTAMETVLADYPGLLVTRSALDDSDSGVALDDLVAHLATLSPDKEIRPSQPWLPPDLTWYRTKPWLCAATTTLPPLVPSDVQVIVDRIDAMDAKLVQLAKGGSRADYPTLWTLTYTTTTPSTIATTSAKAKAGRLVVRVLSDVSGKCWHEPLELTVASKWLTQYGGAIKLGISVLANAAATAPVVGGVLQAAFNLAAAGWL